MKIRFAVGPHAGSLAGAEIVAFAESLEHAGFDGLWLSDLPVAPVLDPLLGLALAAGRTSRLHLGANLVPLGRKPLPAGQRVGPARSDLGRPPAAQLRHRPGAARGAPGARARRSAPRRRARGGARPAAELVGGQASGSSLRALDVRSAGGGRAASPGSARGLAGRARTPRSRPRRADRRRMA